MPETTDEDQSIIDDEEAISEMTADEYIAQVKKLKRDTVPRADYDELKAQARILMEEIANGSYRDQDDDEEEDPVDISELKKKLFSRDSHLNNLEYVEGVLQLRDEAIKRGEVDPFLPIGHDVHIEDSDIEAAEKVAAVLRACVEDADGDPDQFTLNLQKSIR